MKWILRLSSSNGEVFYSEGVDHDGNRRLCRNLKLAEQFGTLHAAESALTYFQLLWEFRTYILDVVELDAPQNDHPLIVHADQPMVMSNSSVS
ncbi:hypothetical protein [Pseudomonas protegens]|uniref:hypothetical protein n=1 Tax=Pseudomonas protegens TaxID=380021 RepID=UPI003209FCE1